jgi:hypothetical protein
MSNLWPCAGWRPCATRRASGKVDGGHPPGAGRPGSPPTGSSCCGPPASSADNAHSAWSTRGRSCRQSRPVASAWFSASTAASSSRSRLRTCPDRICLRSSGARSTSRSHRRMRSTRAARSGGHDRARCPASSAVRTDGNWVPVVVRVSASSAAAWASQADFRRDLQSIQPAISPTTSTISSDQPRAPNPSDSADAGVPAADGVGVEVGGRASAEVMGEVVGEVGRSAEVGVRVGRVGAVVVSLGDSVPLGAGRAPERSVEGRVADSLPPSAPQPLSPRTSTSPASKPALAARRPRTAGPSRRSRLVAMIGRGAIHDVRIDGPPPGRRGGWGSARQETPPFLGAGSAPASPEAGETVVPRRPTPPDQASAGWPVWPGAGGRRGRFWPRWAAGWSGGCGAERRGTPPRRSGAGTWRSSRHPSRPTSSDRGRPCGRPRT